MRQRPPFGGRCIFNSFFAGACTSRKTRCGPQVCERSECAQRAEKNRPNGFAIGTKYQEMSSITREGGASRISGCWKRYEKALKAWA